MMMSRVVEVLAAFEPSWKFATSKRWAANVHRSNMLGLGDEA